MNKSKIYDIKRLYSGEQRVTTFRCKQCDKDGELFRDPFIRKGSPPEKLLRCGCFKNVILKTDQKVILIQRALLRKGMSLVNKLEDTIVNKTPIKVRCNKHGSETTVTYGYLIRSSKKHCYECAGESRSGEKHPAYKSLSDIRKTMESVHINLNLEKIYRKDKRSYGVFECDVCNVSSHALVDNTLRGHRPCKCPKGSYDMGRSLSYLYIVEFFNRNQSFVKYGITNRSVHSRLKEVRSKLSDKTFDYKIINVLKGSATEVFNAEKILKSKEMSSSIEIKNLFLSGYTETVDNTNENLKVFKEFVDKNFLEDVTHYDDWNI